MKIDHDIVSENRFESVPMTHCTLTTTATDSDSRYSSRDLLLTYDAYVPQILVIQIYGHIFAIDLAVVVKRSVVATFDINNLFRNIQQFEV